MNDTTNTDWPTKGEKVAVVTTGGLGTRVAIDTITALTNKHITTSAHGKFRRDDGRPTGRAGTYDSTTTTAMAPNDPRVLDARATIRVRNLGRAVQKATEQFNGGQTAALAVLAEIEQAVAAARAAIEGK